MRKLLIKSSLIAVLMCGGAHALSFEPMNNVPLWFTVGNVVGLLTNAACGSKTLGVGILLATFAIDYLKTTSSSGFKPKVNHAFDFGAMAAGYLEGTYCGGCLRSHMAMAVRQS